VSKSEKVLTKNSENSNNLKHFTRQASDISFFSLFAASLADVSTSLRSVSISFLVIDKSINLLEFS